MVISSSRTPYEQTFNGHVHVFEVELFDGAVDDVTGSRVVPEIDISAAKNRK